MTHKILPRPSVLDDCIPLGQREGRKVWKSQSGHRLFCWDSLHGEVEVFDSFTTGHFLAGCQAALAGHWDQYKSG